MAGGAGRAEPGPPAQPPHGDADGRPERAQGDHHHHRRQVVLQHHHSRERFYCYVVICSDVISRNIWNVILRNCIFVSIFGNNHNM